GVGADQSLTVGPKVIVPGNPFKLQSLDITFDIPASYFTFNVPSGNVTTAVLDLGAVAVIPTANVSGTPTMIQIVPEPSLIVFGALAMMAFGRHRAAQVGRDLMKHH